MQFTREENVRKTLGVGKYALLDTISYIEVDFLEADFGKWVGNAFMGNSKVIRGKFNISGKRGSELMKMLVNESLSRKWLKRFFGLSHPQIDRVTHISLSFGIKPEFRIHGEYVAKCAGEMIYEHDGDIYNIPKDHVLIDDLLVSPRRVHEKFRYFRKKRRGW